MDIEMMRWMDRNIGIPLCFLLSILHRIKNFFFKPAPPHQPRKFLFIELSEMGSMVLAYSLFKKTEELFPASELYFLTFGKNRSAVDILDIFPKNNVWTIDDRNIFSIAASSLKCLASIRKKKISTVIDMEFFSRLTSIFSFLCGAKERIGYFAYHNEGLYRGRLLTHEVVYNPQIHTSFNLLNLIYPLNSERKDLPSPKRPMAEKDLILPKWKVSEEGKKSIIEKLTAQKTQIIHAETIILFNPNASDIIPLRRWPVDNYIQLGHLLLEHEGTFIVITGVEAERPNGKKICQSFQPDRCLNLAGQTTLSELLDLYSVSDALITNDSGPAHFSSMTDIATFVLFGPETPSLYGPLGKNSQVLYAHFTCSPCVSVFNHRRSPCLDNRCLQAISVEEVFKKVKEQLDLK